MTEIQNNDIVEALRRETQRLIDEMHEREEAESYREIAEMTDIPKSTVHRLLEKVN